jgi:hypothetical protein
VSPGGGERPNQWHAACQRTIRGDPDTKHFKNRSSFVPSSDHQQPSLRVSWSMFGVCGHENAMIVRDGV